jgi:hypothetical protein
MKCALICPDVFGQLHGQRGDPLGRETANGGIDGVDGILGELTGLARVASLVGVLAIEACAPVSHVESGSHPITARRTGCHGDVVLHGDAPDADERVPDDFAFQVNLAWIVDMGVEAASAGGITRRFAPVRRCLEDLDDIREGHLLPGFRHAHGDPLPRDGSRNEHDLPFVTRQHAAA